MGGLFACIVFIITMESTKKLQAMISAVSTMLLKGLHGATSKANYREQDINSKCRHTTDSEIHNVLTLYDVHPFSLQVKVSVLLSNMKPCRLIMLLVKSVAANSCLFAKKQLNSDLNQNVLLTEINKTASGFYFVLNSLS